MMTYFCVSVGAAATGQSCSSYVKVTSDPLTRAMLTLPCVCVLYDLGVLPLGCWEPVYFSPVAWERLKCAC